VCPKNAKTGAEKYPAPVFGIYLTNRKGVYMQGLFFPAI
jgi:hypothetical protein